jgi:hypothetical protein
MVGETAESRKGGAPAHPERTSVMNTIASKNAMRITPPEDYSCQQTIPERRPKEKANMPYA